MSEIDTIVCSAFPGERRLAGLAGGRAVAFDFDRPHRMDRIGAVHLGRLRERTDGGLGFVELAGGIVAVLPDIGGRPLGSRLCVQIARPALFGKAPRLTDRIALAGDYLVCSPHRSGIALSRRLPTSKTRQRLKDTVTHLARPGEGWVVRAAAHAVGRDELASEMADLRARVAAFEQAATDGDAPLQLDAGPDPLAALCAASRSAVRIVTNVVEPGLNGAVETVSPDDDPFEDLAGDALAAALARTLALPGGGRATVEETTALVAIDIDAGGGAPAAANAAAGTVLPAEIRLRRLGGQILIDPAGRGGARGLERALARGFAADPDEAACLGPTRGGLIECRRARTAPSLDDLIRGSGAMETMALDGLRRVLRAARHRPGQAAVLHLPPAARALFDGPLKPALAATAARLGAPLRLDSAPQPAHPEPMSVSFSAAGCGS